MSDDVNYASDFFLHQETRADQIITGAPVADRLAGRWCYLKVEQTDGRLRP